jgi:hypothetical protein
VAYDIAKNSAKNSAKIKNRKEVSNMAGIMVTALAALPLWALRAIEEHCKKETKRLGERYSVSRFLREAALEKLEKICNQKKR